MSFDTLQEFRMKKQWDRITKNVLENQNTIKEHLNDVTNFTVGELVEVIRIKEKRQDPTRHPLKFSRKWEIDT